MVPRATRRPARGVSAMTVAPARASGRCAERERRWARRSGGRGAALALVQQRRNVGVGGVADDQSGGDHRPSSAMTTPSGGDRPAAPRRIDVRRGETGRRAACHGGRAAAAGGGAHGGAAGALAGPGCFVEPRGAPRPAPTRGRRRRLPTRPADGPAAPSARLEQRLGHLGAVGVALRRVLGQRPLDDLDQRAPAAAGGSGGGGS